MAPYETSRQLDRSVLRWSWAFLAQSKELEQRWHCSRRSACWWSPASGNRRAECHDEAWTRGELRPIQALLQQSHFLLMKLDLQGLRRTAPRQSQLSECPRSRARESRGREIFTQEQDSQWKGNRAESREHPWSHAGTSVRSWSLSTWGVRRVYNFWTGFRRGVGATWPPLWERGCSLLQRCATVFFRSQRRTSTGEISFVVTEPCRLRL